MGKEIECPRCENKMVDMQLSNNKLVGRGTRMIMGELKITEKEAALLLKQYGSVRAAINSQKDGDK
mgnify:CR=1 FL=1